MEKIAQDKIASLLNLSAQTLTKLAEQSEELEQKLAVLRQENADKQHYIDCVKVAQQLIQLRGGDPSSLFDEADKLAMESPGRLAVIKEAMDLHGSQIAYDSYRTGLPHQGDSVRNGSGLSELDAFVIGG
jgi:hypothetical protein